MDDQLVIKLALIAFFLVFAVILLLPTGGARRSAIRRLTLLSLLSIAILAVIFPSIAGDLAKAAGVGRGTDLLLYGFIVVFLGSSMASAGRARLAERQITELARKIALMEADKPHRNPPIDETV